MPFIVENRPAEQQIMLVKLWVLIVILILISACGKTDKIYQNFCRNVYENANYLNKRNDPDPLIPPHKVPPSYEQYQRERRIMISGSENQRVGHERMPIQTINPNDWQLIMIDPPMRPQITPFQNTPEKEIRE